MRPNPRLLLGFAALGGLALIAGVEGLRRRPTSAADVRASTFVAEPNGAKALADALERLGLEVVKLRDHRPNAFSLDTVASVVAILNPTFGPSPTQVIDYTALPAAGVSLLIAGPNGRHLFRCFGYASSRLDDSTEAALPGSAGPAPWVRYHLEATTDTVVVDSSGVFDSEITECRVPRYPAVDTLLTTVGGEAIAVRLTLAGGAAPVTLVGDVSLFRNRVLRDTDVGPVALDWFVRRYHRVWFPEYLHGYLAGGSLVRWALRWSWESPWGWGAWHLGLVGLLALGFAAVRFGAPVTASPGRRRSVTEHVQALARALRAAGGHRLAIGLLVGGLRRRLTPGAATRGPWRPWLEALGASATNPKVEELGRRLEMLDRDQPSEGEVLSAANLVEDLWTQMRS